MPIDFLGFERQFIDHCAPVWLALEDRGIFLTDAALADHARSKGIDPYVVDAETLRRSPPPKASPGDGPLAFAVSIGDMKLGRRLGYRRFVFMEHGAGQAYMGDQHGARHPSYAGGADRDDVELFLVPNEYSAGLWRTAYPAARVEVVGSPRLDGLPRREHFIGVNSDTWQDFAAVIRTHLRTFASTADGLVCAAHAIADASPIERGQGNSQAIQRRLSTTDGATSLTDLKPLTDRIDHELFSTALVRLAMSECTGSSKASCRGRAISAAQPIDWKSLSAGTRLRSTGSSIPGQATLSLEIQTTTFGSVSLAIPNTTRRATSLATCITRAAGSDPTICVSFHWPAFVAPEADSAVGYFKDVLPALAKRFDVIGHAHPKGHWPAEMERIYRVAGIPFVRDFDDVCRQADVYVCDNSSTLFEFAATGRPVVVMNSPYYRKNVRHGLRFWDAADVGVQVDRQDDLIAGIERALVDAPEQRANREAALDIVYAFRSGAAARAAAAIGSLALQAVA